MRRTDFEYELPQRLIAQVPIKDRTAARLLVLNRATGQTVHTQFSRLHEFLRPGDLLVLNDTRVLRCRLHGHRVPGGGKVELFLLRRLEQGLYEALGKASRPLRPGSEVVFGGGRLRAIVIDKKDGKLVVSLSVCVDEPLDRVLDEFAELPLPPYIRRPHGPDRTDEVLYQTVYSQSPGAVAAPTAGLHFDQQYIEHLRRHGIEFASVTVHTGLGSFKPIRSDSIEDHAVPPEEFNIGQDAAGAVNLAKKQQRRVIVVGTSCARALETAAKQRMLVAQTGMTDLYITPGYHFRIVDAMITNFHQPASSLLVLICAFAGREMILDAYHEAIREGYRFLSFGDAMLII